MRLLVAEPQSHGGMLHYSVQLGDALAARGHDVTLLTPRDNELLGRALYANMQAELPRLAVHSERPATGLAYRARQARVALRLLRSWWRILVETRRGGYDAMITGADTQIVLTALAALLLTAIPGRPPLIRISHNVRVFNRWSGEELYRDSPLLHRLLRTTYPRFDLTVLPGERARTEYEAHWPPSPAVIVPHPDERIFAEEPPPPSPEERILFFGEWRKVKGLGVLMEAFDELVRRRTSVRLTIAGTPLATDTDPDAVRRWAAAHGERVEVIDRYVPMDEVPGVFARARVVVTPYLTGYQSGVIALAMTMARAVVTTDVGELGTTVGHRVAGLVVPPGDHMALAIALEEVVSDPELAARYGAEARRRGVEGAGWETAAERLEAAITAATNRGNTALPANSPAAGS
jgi:glycosyltransferase involved in cell wall biosynthesis